MIDHDHRSTILTLHRKGVKVRAIARSLSIGRNTVRRVIASGGQEARRPAANAVILDDDLLRKLFNQCEGYVERVWEKLKEEHHLEVGYSTLTRRIRGLGLRGNKPRSGRVPDEPGKEMQQDTSPYCVKISGVPTKVTGCSLYFRYSKESYLKFYPFFDRFAMKCFFHESLMHYRYSAETCIVDNTNLVVLRGSGKNALMVPEMEVFAKRYGFHFVAHAIKHCNRKAGEERGFWTVETNFFPGRTFASIEDLNRQAFVWATETRSQRRRAKTGLIPARAFEEEKPYLTKIPDGMHPPYRRHDRVVDQYGFIAFSANSFWIPTSITGSVVVLEYADKIKIFQNNREVVTYDLPPFGTRGEIFPKDRSHIGFQPRHRDRPSAHEETALRSISPSVSQYLDKILKDKGVTRHRIIRDLHSLHRRVTPDLFRRVIERALVYRVVDIKSLERMAVLLVRDGSEHIITPSYDEDYEKRENYIEGRYVEPPNLSSLQGDEP
jgi:hypothetical protein